jgi:YHS domain-containing protein
MRMLLWLLLIYVGYRIVKGYLGNQEKPTPARVDTETFQDPVCGVYVAADDAVIGRLDDKRIHFCSMSCLEKYREKLAAENH